MATKKRPKRQTAQAKGTTVQAIKATRRAGTAGARAAADAIERQIFEELAGGPDAARLRKVLERVLVDDDSEMRALITRLASGEGPPESDSEE